MTATKHYRRTILTAADGTGSVNLPFPSARVSNVEITKGTGEITLEALSTAGCRLFVTGGTLDGPVTVEFDLA